MEKTTSVSSQMKGINLSYISPVKQFDQEQCSYFGGEMENQKLKERHVSPRNIKFVPTELVNLKAKLKETSEELRKCQAVLNTACKILQEVLESGEIDQPTLESFLEEQRPRKRKVKEPPTEAKKIKVAELELHKSFDCFVPPETNRKRKFEECTNQEDLEPSCQIDSIEEMLAPPCKKVKQKEDELEGLDKKIAKDREDFKKMENTWADGEKNRLKSLKQVEKKRKYALDLKQILNDELADDEKLKAFAENSLPFLEKVYNGSEPSERHNQFFSKNRKVSQNLLYTCIENPFAEEQTNLVYSLLKEHFQHRSGIEDNYIQWVLLSESMLHIYCDFFSIKDKKEALDLIHHSSPVDVSDSD
eukprot:GFUD01027113.1.p1 GENE.GFUD01027113.1~~GFUD01027113.1.p1  ORF type:complete len:361 (-),score=83.06 GFUD01027113.1:36-1118(-)